MKILCTAAQFPVTLSVKENLAHIFNVLENAASGGIVVFPEGSVSGYATDPSFLEAIDVQAVQSGLEKIQSLAERKKLLVWVGTCYQEDSKWYNAAWGFASDGEKYVYKKVNLATSERQRFSAGDVLPVFRVFMPDGELKVGVQLCREIRFPEQWGWLARQGAEIILHLNNAVGDEREQAVWKSHLVSRAAETQRYVVSVNNAGEAQKCPTIIVTPKGQIMGEMISSTTGEVKAVLDTGEISNWYLGQCREDVVRIEAGYAGEKHPTHR